jgi:hypothetical protein
MILLNDDGANLRRFAVSVGSVTKFASTSHITVTFLLTVIFFHLVSMSKIAKFSHLQAVHE